MPFPSDDREDKATALANVAQKRIIGSKASASFDLSLTAGVASGSLLHRFSLHEYGSQQDRENQGGGAVGKQAQNQIDVPHRSWIVRSGLDEPTWDPIVNNAESDAVDK